MAQSQIVDLPESFEIVFRSPVSAFKERTPRFWGELFGDDFGPSLGKILSSERDDAFEAFAFERATLFVGERRLLASGFNFKAAHAILRVLKRAGGVSLDTLVYQMGGVGGLGGREFRQGLMLLRSEAGPLLGASVVAEETALFHPPPHGPRLQQGAIRLQAQMRQFSRRLGGVDALRIRGFFPGFQLSEHQQKNQYSLVGVRGLDCFSLRVPAVAGLGIASFDACCSGSKSQAQMSEALEKVMKLYLPRQRRVTVLHGDRDCRLPEFAHGRWETQSLGALDSLSILVENVNKRMLSATA